MRQGGVCSGEPRMINNQPQSIDKRGDEELSITWEDGHNSVFSFRHLRLSCPCAMCKDEFTGALKLDPASVPNTLTAGRADLVGQYALSFAFSDGHTTGIYSFEYLREICPCRECSYHSGSETN